MPHPRPHRPRCLLEVWTLHNPSAARRPLIWHSEYDWTMSYNRKNHINSIGNDGLCVQSLLIIPLVQHLRDPPNTENMWASVFSGYTVTTKSRWSYNQRTWTLTFQTLRFHGQLLWRSALITVWLGRYRHLILSSDTIIKICHALALSYNIDIFMPFPNPKGCVLHLKGTPLNWRSFP